MRELRIRLRLRSSYVTPFHADIIFGHFCWAIAYRHGEQAVSELLARYDASPPLLISDGFPLLGEQAYLPMPQLPPADPAKLAATLGIASDDRQAMRLYVAALKRMVKKPFVATNALQDLGSRGLQGNSILAQVFKLHICPCSFDIRATGDCACRSWRDCPALNPEARVIRRCKSSYPGESAMAVMHNTLNRISLASEQLYAQAETWPGHDIYFLAAIDESRFSRDLLNECLEYLLATGYGKDRSLGKGAITAFEITDSDLAVPDGANAFVSLSSAYMPQAGELDAGACYQPYVKYGKLSGEFALQPYPFKRPLVMLRAGAVIAGTPERIYGGLVHPVHYEHPEVVQYGYAYPLWVKRYEDLS